MNSCVIATDSRSKVSIFIDGDKPFLASRVKGSWVADDVFEAQDLYDNFAEVPLKEAAALINEAKAALSNDAAIRLSQG